MIYKYKDDFYENIGSKGFGFGADIFVNLTSTMIDSNDCFSSKVRDLGKLCTDYSDSLELNDRLQKLNIDYFSAYFDDFDNLVKLKYKEQ